jgi:hypothetical protein
MRCHLRGLTEKNSIGTSKISEHAILIAITIEQFVGDPEEGRTEFCTTACRSRSELLVDRLRPAPSCDLPGGVTLRDCEEYVQITAARIITTGDPTNHQRWSSIIGGKSIEKSLDQGIPPRLRVAGF